MKSRSQLISRRISCARHRLFCCSCGNPDAEAVLFLHGNGEDHRIFSRQTDDFARTHFLMLPDSYAHGKSAVSGTETVIENGCRRRGLSLKSLAADLSGVLDAYGVSRAAVVGYSDGANIALHFALQHPERVAALVLAGGNLFPSGVRASTQIPTEISYRMQRLLGRFSETAARRADVLGLMVGQPHFRPQSLCAIQVPVLVLAGEHDVIRPEHTELIAASLPKAELQIIPKAGHDIFGDAPQTVNRLILDFLRGIRY